MKALLAAAFVIAFFCASLALALYLMNKSGE